MRKYGTYPEFLTARIERVGLQWMRCEKSKFVEFVSREIVVRKWPRGMP